MLILFHLCDGAEVTVPSLKQAMRFFHGNGGKNKFLWP